MIKNNIIIKNKNDQIKIYKQIHNNGNNLSNDNSLALPFSARAFISTTWTNSIDSLKFISNIYETISQNKSRIHETINQTSFNYLIKL